MLLGRKVKPGKNGKDKGNVGYRAKKRFEIAERRKKVAVLYLRKMHQQEIADYFGVTNPVIHYDLKVIGDQWMRDSKVEIDKHRAKALAALDQLEVAGWKGDDLFLILRIMQERNKINGIYPIEKFETRVSGKISGELTLMAAIKHALTLNHGGDNKIIDNVQNKRLSRNKKKCFVLAKDSPRLVGLDWIYFSLE